MTPTTAITAPTALRGTSRRRAGPPTKSRTKAASAASRPGTAPRTDRPRILGAPGIRPGHPTRPSTMRAASRVAPSRRLPWLAFPLLTSLAFAGDAPSQGRVVVLKNCEVEYDRVTTIGANVLVQAGG